MPLEKASMYKLSYLTPSFRCLPMNCYNRIHLASAVTDAAWFLDTPMTAWVWILGPMKAVTVTLRAFMPARYKPFITCASCASVIWL